MDFAAFFGGVHGTLCSAVLARLARFGKLLICTTAVAASLHSAEPYYVFSHVAGSTGGPGSVDGPATSARFYGPSGVAVDSGGNVYVADSGNHVIRRISAAGIVSTVAGSAGVSGSADGTGGAARFNGPSGITVDATGNLFVADFWNCTIRKISPLGVVTTVAGSAGVKGSGDAAGTAARFMGPSGVAVAPGGDVYIADVVACTIRKLSATGGVTTVAGTAGERGSTDGLTSAARFNAPQRVAVDLNGNLYVSDWFNATIRKITPDGQVSTLAGSPGQKGDANGQGPAARFNDPVGICVDSNGVVYVADVSNSLVRKITPDGNVTTFAGGGGHATLDGVGTDARFLAPQDIACDSARRVYVADTGNYIVRAISPVSEVTTIAGAAPESGGVDGAGIFARFNNPQGGAVVGLDGALYVADTNNYAIRRVASDGVVTTFAGSMGKIGNADGPRANARFGVLQGLAMDKAGNFYAADNFAIRKISVEGIVTTIAGSTNERGSVDGIGLMARFDFAGGLGVDNAGNIFVADSGNQTIRKISPAGVVTTFAGLAGSAGNADGIGANARFRFPKGIAVDNVGNVYVTDYLNDTVRRISPSGAVTTFAGHAGEHDGIDGSATTARFYRPSGIAIDAQDNLYVTDVGTSTIRRIRTDGMVSTIGGNFSQPGTENGPGFVARFNFPLGVALDGSGVLFVVDTNNAAIRRGVLTEPAARLINIATRSYCTTGNAVTVGGFVVTGHVAKRVLIRAVGPSLTSYGIGASEVLSDPVVALHRGPQEVAKNDNWTDSLNLDDISQTTARIGASPLQSSDTTSSVLLLTVEPGVYSLVVSGSGGRSGIVLLEVYDADALGTGESFVNIATRTYASTGNGVAIGGFVVAGDAPKRILLRAVGPTLTSFGISTAEVLMDPTIELHDSSGILAANDNWRDNSNAAGIITAGERIGATSFSATDSTSSALMLTLRPGAYSFVASGKNTSSGIVLVEIYDAD